MVKSYTGLKESTFQSGYRRVVTILYADIVGSTKILSALDPDDIEDFLDPAIEKIIRAVHQFGGTVARVQGDGVKAVFGATDSMEDHALRAVLAGQEIVSLIQGTRERPKMPKPDIRVGMHSGFVIIRWQDTDFGGGLDTVGSTSHVAAKIEAMAAHNQVWISETTANLLPRGIDYVSVAKTKLIKHELGFNAYEMRTIHPDRIAGYTHHHLSLPLIGRTTLLEQLKLFTRSNGRNTMSTRGIVGDAGVGKSRLVMEVALHAAQNGVRVESINAPPVFSNIPYHFIANMASRFLRINRNTEISAQDVSYWAMTPDSLHFKALANLLGPDPRSVANWDLHPNEKAMAINDMMVMVLNQVTDNKPLLLIVEDVHNIDDESLQSLKSIIQTLDERPISIISTSRPAGQARTRLMSDKVIYLDALNQETTRALLEASCQMLPDLKVSNEQFESICKRSGGLPLAALELLKHSQESDMAVKQNATTPLALEPVFHRRLDALETDARQLMEYASAIGSEAGHNILISALGWKQRRFKRALKEIFTRNLLISLNTEQVAFTHHMLHEISYGALSRRSRQKIHADVYHSMRKQDDFPQDILARHAEEIGDYEQALIHLWNACEQALAQSAIRTTKRLYVRATEICNRLGSAALAQNIRFAMLVFGAFHQLSIQNKLESILTKGLNSPKINLSALEHVIMSSDLALLYWIKGQNTLAHPLIKAAEKEASKIEKTDHLLNYLIQFTLANIEFSQGNATASTQRLETLITFHSGFRKSEKSGFSVSLPSVMSRTFAAWHYVDLGRHKDAALHLEDAETISTIENHKYSFVNVFLVKGYLRMRQCRWQEAVEILSEAHLLCERNTFNGQFPFVSAFLSRALIEYGDLREAEKILNNEFKSNYFPSIQTSNLYYLISSQARLLEKRNMLEQALRKRQKSLDAAKKIKEPIHIAYGHYEYAQTLHRTKGDKKAARIHIQKALGIADQCKMAILSKQCLADLNKP